MEDADSGPEAAARALTNTTSRNTAHGTCAKAVGAATLRSLLRRPGWQNLTVVQSMGGVDANKTERGGDVGVARSLVCSWTVRDRSLCC